MTAYLRLDRANLQSLSERFVVMADGLLGSFAEWQGKIGVGFLSIVVGTDRVHPEDHFLTVLVLVIVFVQPRWHDPRREHERESD